MAIDITQLPKSIPCAALEPIYWSKLDTRITQDKVTEYNGVYVRNCK